MSNHPKHAETNPWLMWGPPPESDFVVFGFNYAGVGAASTYHDWPAQLGGGAFCPLQPPGREDRIAESHLTSHRAFGEQVARAIEPYVDRPFAFIGHCGAFCYMLETTFALRALGLTMPRLLIASSWGPPDRGPYGRLNFLDLDELDVVDEIQQVSVTRFGRKLPTDMAEIAAEALMHDLRLQRAFRYDGDPQVPVATVVIGWSDDDVVPLDQVWPGWERTTKARYRELAGDHWAFLGCPDALQDLIATEMAARL